jgi:hypothetical protein
LTNHRNPIFYGACLAFNVLDLAKKQYSTR